MSENYHTYPRIYQDTPLAQGALLKLGAGASHYLRNVLRQKEGDMIRVFNGRDGEYLAALQEVHKKGVVVEMTACIRAQSDCACRAHLLFAPIKKARMEWLIEKAVELGVTDLHPVITARTQNRRLNEERMRAQIIEASEQCERLDIPTLHEASDLTQKIASWGKPLFWAAEREVAAHSLAHCLEGDVTEVAFLIGPEGGFDEAEFTFLAGRDHITPISLGQDILRAETAALLCLAQVKLYNS